MDQNKRRMILNELKNIMGMENASDNPAVTSSYRYIQGPGGAPEIVAMPRTVEHVQEIVRLANREKLSILPISMGTKAWSREVDILVDMMKMNKVIKVDPENCYALLETGVSFNQVDPLLEKVGYTMARGTFPISFSVVGNHGVVRSFNHNFSGRIGDQTLGMEVVLMDGTLLRTGLATYGIDFWSTMNMDVPDYRGLFQRYNQKTPLLGIITKAAIRIWPRLEAQGFPIGGFDSFAGAMRYCQAVTKAGIADQSMVWSWVIMAMVEAKARESKNDIDFLNYRMAHDYSEPYKGMHYCYTWTQFRGYKETVDANLKVCKRIAKENGGKILTEKQLEATIPKVSAVLKSHYKDFHFIGEKDGAPMLLWFHGGEGLGETCYYYGWVEDLIKLEIAYNKRLTETYKHSPVPYYVRIMEGGVGAHLRYIPFIDLMDEKEAATTLNRSAELHAWVHENFPNIHCPMGDRHIETDSIGMGDIMNKIREALDPNHVGYVAGDKRLEPEPKDEEAAVAS